jgi:hypothetical protein
VSDFAQVDVTSWVIAAVEQLGTKPKRWVVHPDTHELWLMKDATFNRRADGSTYAKGDDWAERIATDVADELGLPAARTELAVSHADGVITNGVVSRKVLDDVESLVHGNELLAEIGITGETGHDRTGYTLGAVEHVLATVAPPDQRPEGFSAWDCFTGYLLLDALIGNTDRHQENWAVIANGGRRLAPTFDHASSLGFQLDDERRVHHLTTRDKEQSADAYADRAQSRFEANPHPIDVAAEALAAVEPAVRAHWIERCRAFPDLADIVNRVPAGRMSGPAKSLAVAIFNRNRYRLMSHPVCTL